MNWWTCCIWEQCGKVTTLPKTRDSGLTAMIPCLRTWSTHCVTSVASWSNVHRRGHKLSTPGHCMRNIPNAQWFPSCNEADKARRDGTNYVTNYPILFFPSFLYLSFSMIVSGNLPRLVCSGLPPIRLATHAILGLLSLHVIPRYFPSLPSSNLDSIRQLESVMRSRYPSLFHDWEVSRTKLFVRWVGCNGLSPKYGVFFFSFYCQALYVYMTVVSNVWLWCQANRLSYMTLQVSISDGVFPFSLSSLLALSLSSPTSFWRPFLDPRRS